MTLKIDFTTLITIKYCFVYVHTYVYYTVCIVCTYIIIMFVLYLLCIIYVGTFAVVSLMIGQGVDRLVLINHIPCEEGSAGSSNATNITDCVEFKSGVAITITFLSGTILVSPTQVSTMDL